MSHTPKRPCVRCGVVRSSKGGPLCRDCIGSLTAKERKEWLSKPKSPGRS